MSRAEHMRLHGTGRTHSEESRRKISASKMGHTFTVEARAKISATKRADPRTTEVAKANNRRRSVFTESDIASIRDRISRGAFHHDIAAEYGVSRVCITYIALRRTWADVA